MVSKEFLNGTCAFYTDPYAAGEQSPAILRETFDTNQPRPLPPTRIQTEAHPLPSPKQLVVYQDPLPSAHSAGTIHPWSSLPHVKCQSTDMFTETGLLCGVYINVCQ